MNSIYDELTRYSPDGLIHNNERLAELQALPLHQKIGITIARISEWYKAFNGNIYVSLSGGKDSTVLWDITHKLFPDVPAVFSNTGLEYPEIQQFAKNICTDIVSPEMTFTEVIKNYGYPIISKEVSEAIYYARRNTPPKRSRVEETGTYRQTTANQSKQILGRQTIWKRLELMGQRPICARTNYWNSQDVPPPVRRTHNLQKAIRVARTTKRLISNRRAFAERCLWVVSQVAMAIKNQPLTKKNGCHLFTFHLRYPIIVAM